MLIIYFAGRKAGKGAPVKQVKLPKGVSIPSQWTPRPVTVKLYNAMKGFGTDTKAIWSALEPLNDAQKALVYSDFGVYCKEKKESDTDLLTWFSDDLSGDDLSRAVAYFKGIV